MIKFKIDFPLSMPDKNELILNNSVTAFTYGLLNFVYSR